MSRRRQKFNRKASDIDFDSEDRGLSPHPAVLSMYRDRRTDRCETQNLNAISTNSQPKVGSIGREDQGDRATGTCKHSDIKSTIMQIKLI